MKLEVFILGGQRIIRRERRDGGEARGNEEGRIEKGSREKIERKEKREKRKERKGN